MDKINIQIIGTKKDFDTQKAIRFFKERGITPHFRDIKEKSPSPGELNNISAVLGSEALLDTEGKAYRKKGLAYMEFDIIEEILENPLLLKVPVVRYTNKATVGYSPEEWEEWLR